MATTVPMATKVPTVTKVPMATKRSLAVWLHMKYGLVKAKIMPIFQSPIAKCMLIYKKYFFYEKAGVAQN